MPPISSGPITTALPKTTWRSRQPCRRSPRSSRIFDERRSAILDACLSEEGVASRDIADRFGVTPERIGQIRRDLLADMAIFLKKKGITVDDLF